MSFLHLWIFERAYVFYNHFHNDPVILYLQMIYRNLHCAFRAWPGLEGMSSGFIPVTVVRVVQEASLYFIGHLGLLFMVSFGNIRGPICVHIQLPATLEGFRSQYEVVVFNPWVSCL